MKNTLSLLILLAGAGSSMAAVTAISSVTVDNTSDTTKYILQKITVGSTEYLASNLANGTSSGSSSAGGVIGNMDNKDLNSVAGRNGETPPEINTINFSGGNFVSVGGALDFFLFETAGGSNPDDVAVAPIFANDTVGVSIDLLQTGWGGTGLNSSSAVNNGQPIQGIGWKITDMKDAGGNFLAQNAVIKGIRILNSTANTGAGNVDPVSFLAVIPEPGSAVLLGFSMCALLGRRSRAKG